MRVHRAEKEKKGSAHAFHLEERNRGLSQKTEKRSQVVPPQRETRANSQQYTVVRNAG